MTLLSLIILAFGLCAVQANEQIVFCFWGTWATYREGDGQFNVEDLNVDLCNYIAYSFLGIDDEGFIKSLDSWLDLPNGRDYLRKFSALKQKNADLKRMLAVGGWNEGSKKYSLMAGNETLRANFVNSTTQMILDYDMDGLELNWDYPNRRDTVRGKEDIENFTQLIKELKEAFDEHGFILTAAVAAIGEVASQSYDVKGISQYLDYIQVMTYDLHGPWENVTGHNSALHKRDGDEDEPTSSLFTVDVAIDYWINSGASANKILLGIPFFGHSFKLSNASEHGVKASSTGPGIQGPFTVRPGDVAYNEFCVMLRTEPWSIEYDCLAEVPYAYKDLDWVSYANPESTEIAAHYAMNRGLAGVMLWSIESDDFHAKCGPVDFPLLRAVNLGLGREVPLPTITTPATTTKPNNGLPSMASFCKSTTTTEAPGYRFD